VNWPTWTSDDGRIRLINADCAEVLPTLTGIDAVVTDPPYGLGDLMEAGEGNEWSGGFAEAPVWDTQTVAPEIICGLPRFGECIIWGGNYYPLPPVRGWLSWDKKQEHTSGHFELAWTNLNIPNRVFRLSRVEAYSRMNKQHPTQKPVALIEWCLSFLPDCQMVCDPFGGSMTTAVACVRLDRSCVCIERDPGYFAQGIKRMEREYKRTELFNAQEAIA
jgi:site-specific DNA-methyltransferase (adenine-specific)